MNPGGRVREPRVIAVEPRSLEDRITEFMDRPHFSPLWINESFLRDSGVYERVEQMLDTSGWLGLLSLSCDADKNDTAEFLATFHFIGHGEDQGFSYQHRGEKYECTMHQLRQIFGWPQPNDQSIYHPPNGNWNVPWSAISSERYNGGVTKARDLRDPAIYYLHHVLNKTLSAKKNADKVGRCELSVLFLLHEGHRVDWGYYFCIHLKNLRANSPICCGGMITYILKTLHPIPVPPNHEILPCAYADRIWFQTGQSIQVTHEGEIQWCYFTDPERRPAPIVARSRGRPPIRGRGRGRGHALVIYEEQEQQLPPRQQYQYPQGGVQQDPQDQMIIDYVFNNTRASILGVQQPMVPAPVGWRPGDPIPPEFL